MEVLTLLLFVSAVWVLGALGLFAWTVLQRNHEHAERLAILPLEDNWNDPRGRVATRTSQQEGKGVHP
ncbi:MAG: hypothetical protein RL385_1334 [Pseudomonadota bacterium]|jgi:hypothetical protein